jgi:hypothetical protein
MRARAITSKSRGTAAATFNAIYVNRSNPYGGGQAYQDGAVLTGVDLAGTITEEESPGSATAAHRAFHQRSLRITGEP